MDKSSARLLNNTTGVTLAIRVTPRASKNQVAQIMADGTIKITLTAPPVEGKANTALAKFLAEILQVPISSIEIIAGASGRSKLVSISGLDAEVANQRIVDSLAKQK
jgi:uncharacterized protein (TIGR00251 family)